VVEAGGLFALETLQGTDSSVPSQDSGVVKGNQLIKLPSLVLSVLGCTSYLC
jgi:hypothetical protein